MSQIINILRNRNFILPFAFAAGLSFSGLAEWTQPMVIPVLATVMTVSITTISSKELWPPRVLFQPTLKTILLNYVLLSTLILFLAWLLIPTQELWIGFVLIAAAPPGIAIIPFSVITGGNLKSSLLGTFGTYLAALIITPLLTFLLLEGVVVPTSRLISALIQLIIVPILVSRLLIFTHIDRYLHNSRGTIVNWGLFIVVFTVIGLNRDVFIYQPVVILIICLIGFLTTFGVAFILQRILRKFKVIKPELILQATIKNSGFASAIALTLIDEKASIPGAGISAVYALYFIWLGFKNKSLLS